MYIKVKVAPNSRSEDWRPISKDHFEADVREKAKRNEANRRVLELVADYFRIPLPKVKIISGHHSPRKIISVDIL